MKLPNPENTIIDEQKLAGYSLKLEHADGKHKACVFKSALDLEFDDIEELKAALLKAVKTYDAIFQKRNQYGQKYVIDFLMTRLDKQAIVRSVWIVKYNENFPRLVTCYVI